MENDIKDTENYKNENKKSYHITIPKINALSLNQKIFWKKFKDSYGLSNKFIDTGHLGTKGKGKWFRLPNQLKGIDGIKIKNITDSIGTEHIIKNGVIIDFILKNIPENSINIDYLILKNKKKIKY